MIKSLMKKLGLERNDLLVHFFLCSIGLIGVLRLFSLLLVSHFFTEQISFNEWAIPFYYPDKKVEIVRYLVSAVVLFLYYTVAFLLVNRKKKTGQKEWFQDLKLFKNQRQFYIFTFFCLTINLICVYANRISFFNSTTGFSIVLLIWLINISVPFIELLLSASLSFTKNHFGKIKIVYYILSAVVLIQFIAIFLPFVRGKLNIMNEYFDVPQQTIIGGKLINDTEFINNYGLIGNHEKYDLEKDAGKNPANGGNCLDFAKTRDMENFINSNNSKYYYDDQQKKLCIIGAMTREEAEILNRISPDEEKRFSVDRFYALNVINENRLSKRPYSPQEKEFIQKNQFILHWQILNRYVIHHHNHILGPINEYSLGKKLSEIYSQYGTANTVIMKSLLDLSGGINYQNYFRVFYSFYYLYYLLFFILLVVLFKRIDYALLGTILTVSSLNQTGFGFLLLGPGMNPIRHFFDIFIIILFFRYLTGRKSVYLISALAISLLGILNNSQFGLFALIALVVTGLVRIFLESDIEGKEKRYDLKLLAIFTFMGIVLFFLCRVGPDYMFKYFLYGFLGFTLGSKIMFITLSVITLSYILLIKYFTNHKPFKYLLLFLILYAQGLFTYYIWGVTIEHFLGIAQILILTGLTALYYIINVNGSLKKYENVLVSFFILASIFLYAPSTYSYYFSKPYYSYISLSECNKIFQTHKTYQWDFDKAKFTSTMDPRYFAAGVNLLKKYSPENSVFIISKYDNILPFLANKYSAMPFFDLSSFLLTQKEIDQTVEAVRAARPRYIFVDTDINRNYNSDIINEKVAYLGYLNQESVWRVKRLSLLKIVFEAVRNEYKPVEQTALITAYERK